MDKLLIIRNTLLCLMCLVLIGIGLTMKQDRRAERREARAEQKAEEQAAALAQKEAQAQAKAELDNFFKAVPYVARDEALVKITHRVNGTNEHLWVGPFDVTRRIGNAPFELEGRLVDVPEHISGLTKGQKISFSRVQIVDWGLIVDGKGYGYFTWRAHLPRMSADQAARLSSILAPSALPPGWPNYPAAPEAPKKVLEPKEAFLAKLTNPPQDWGVPMARVAWTEIVKKDNGSTVGYAQSTWVSDIEVLGNGRFTGKPVNDVIFGQSGQDQTRMEFKANAIADWGLVKDGTGYGFMTLRKASASRTPLQKQALKAFLSADPLPAGWRTTN